MESRKYGRTWHYPFSPGTTSDDKIQQNAGREEAVPAAVLPKMLHKLEVPMHSEAHTVEYIT